MANPAPIKLETLFKYYRGLPHQTAAIQQLEQDLAVNGYAAAMRRDRTWFVTWSQDGKQTELTAALRIIEKYEGWRAEAYICPAGVPTIGWGTTRYSDGRPVKLGDKMNRVEGDALLKREVERIVDKLRTTVPHWNEMEDHQRCALISFGYNLGANFMNSAGFETISRVLREKDWDAVPEALLLYRNPGTSFEAGLKRRRQEEGQLWKGQSTPAPQKQQSAAKLNPDSPFSARITPHIRIGEFALDQEARRFDHQHQVDTATELANFLERVRTAFWGKPIVITSGYRPPAVNRSVGGATGSEHLYSKAGEGAVDFYVHGASIKEVQDWCDKNWPYSVGYGAPKGFVHLGRRADGSRRRWNY